MRTGIGTKKLAINFHPDSKGIYGVIWVDGEIVGVTPTVESKRVHFHKDGKLMQVCVADTSFWVRPKWVQVY